MPTTPTPLLSLPGLADRLGVQAILMKDESLRELGNFKSLGGMRAARLALSRSPGDTLICASDGNHGLSVAAAAQAAGVAARIYLPAATPSGRVARISQTGAQIVLAPGTYDFAVEQAAAAAARGEGLLIADTADDPGDEVVMDVMDGYATLADEIRGQLRERAPTHLFAQAGVGGLAAAMAQGLRPVMAQPRRIVVVEPANAACVAAALAHGAPVQVEGDLETCAEMLSCGRASAPALQILMRHQTAALLVDESALRAAPRAVRRFGGPATSPSGAAGVAGLLTACADASARARLGLQSNSVILLFITEGPSP